MLKLITTWQALKQCEKSHLVLLCSCITWGKKFKRDIMKINLDLENMQLFRKIADEINSKEIESKLKALKILEIT